MVADALKCKSRSLPNIDIQSSEWCKSQSTYTNARQHACPREGQLEHFISTIYASTHQARECSDLCLGITSMNTVNMTLPALLVKQMQIEETHTPVLADVQGVLL